MLSVTQAFGLRERLDQTPEMRLVSSCSRPPRRAPCQETRGPALGQHNKRSGPQGSQLCRDRQGARRSAGRLLPP